MSHYFFHLWKKDNALAGEGRRLRGCLFMDFIANFAF